MLKQLLFVVTVLQFSPVSFAQGRGKPSSYVPARQTAGPALYCTERNFPQDITCNLDMIYSYSPFKKEGSQTLSSLRFHFLLQRRQAVNCSVSYIPGAVGSPTRLSYRNGTFYCSPIYVPLSELKMSQVSVVTLDFLRDYSYGCTFQHVFERFDNGNVFKDKSIGKVIKYCFKDMSCGPISVTGLVDGAPAPDCKTDENGRCRPVK